MTVHARVLDVGKVRLVQVEVHRFGIVTQRSSNEFCDRLSVFFIRFDEFGLHAIEIVECDSGKVLHGYPIISIVRLVQRVHCRFQSMHVASTMQGKTAKETEVIGVPFGMDGFPLQSDDSFVVLHVSRKSRAHASERMIDDAIDEEGGIRHEFTHPRRIRSLLDSPLQDIAVLDAFHKLVKLIAVGDETGFVQVPSATVTRRMVVYVSSRDLVPQKEPLTEIDLECSGLFQEHPVQRLL